MALSHLLPRRQSFPRWEPQASKLLEVSVAAWMLLFKSWWRGSLEKNLKNKYSDSSLLFRLSSRKSQPRAPETKGNIQHWAGSAPVRSPDCQWGGGEGGSRLQNPEQGLALKGQCVLVLPPRREGVGGWITRDDVFWEQALSHIAAQSSHWLTAAVQGLQLEAEPEVGFLGRPAALVSQGHRGALESKLDRNIQIFCRQFIVRDAPQAVESVRPVSNPQTCHLFSDSFPPWHLHLSLSMKEERQTS